MPPPHPPIRPQEQVPLLPLSLQWHCVSVLPACRDFLFGNKRAAAAASLTPCNGCFVICTVFCKSSKNEPPSEASITPILVRGNGETGKRAIPGYYLGHLCPSPPATTSPPPPPPPPSLSKLRPQSILRLPLTKPIPPLIPPRLPASLPLILQTRLTLSQLIPTGPMVVDAAVIVGEERRAPTHGAGGTRHGRRGHAKVVDGIVRRVVVVVLRDGEGLCALERLDPLVGFALGAFGFFKGVVGAVLVGG